MKNERKIVTGLTIAGQPTAQELENLSASGYRTVVNLRDDNEPGSLPDEERLVESAGLSYASIPVSSGTLDDPTVQRFIQAVDSDDAQPALVHCAGGGRAGIMVLLHLAMQHGWSVAHTIEEGAKLGIAPGHASPYRAFVEDYIRRHSPAERVGS